MERLQHELVNRRAGWGADFRINLYDLSVKEILKERDIWSQILEMESLSPKSSLNYLQGVLDPEAHLVPTNWQPS